MRQLCSDLAKERKKKEEREKELERQKEEAERRRRDEEIRQQHKSKIDRQAEIRDARLMSVMTSQLKSLHDKLVGQMNEVRSKVQSGDLQRAGVEKLREEVLELERKLAKEDSPEKEKDELRRKLTQLRKLKEESDRARVKKKVLEEEMRWEMKQMRKELEFEEDQFAPSSSARAPPKRRTETPATPSRPRRLRQPNMGIRIEEPSTPRTPVTRSRTRKNPAVDNEALVEGWREITREGAKTNVMDLCMKMRGYLRTRSMSELQCLGDEEGIAYETRDKTIKALLSTKMQFAIRHKTVRSDVEDDQEEDPGRDPDLEDNGPSNLDRLWAM
ncbi:hypothetical protein CBR_g4066 [Chara braunii]|uniref:Uncharacterized protein n=1 Tax=Chara braunii TaxID=69332 RepID=A0A388KHC3_CHABU|nr:hypothetical protein CBR_g4066 [Chara braunii]|eukprot:GBG69373.1 hypothetical protein CBR_g4066 [Chara braunii]